MPYITTHGWLRALAIALLVCAGALPAAAAAPRPNILVIVADDLGFSDVGAFGGEIDTPNLDQLAFSGLRLSGFHTAATCSPTRSMLMSGTDNHIAGLGNMSELLVPAQRGRPGYEGYLSQRVVSLPEVLRGAGYHTLMSGKWHLGVEPQQDPFARGFEHSFALLQAGHNHFGLPNLPPKELGGVTYTEDGKPVQLPADFYSSDYFTDKLLELLRADLAKGDDQQHPFFAYLPFTAPHWPLQAPKALIDKYKDRYTAGWEALRVQRLKRLQQLGLLPPHADWSAPKTMADWNQLSPEQKARNARAMAIYAAMVDRLDWNVGRVLEFLREHKLVDNTVIVFFSDNGAEGSTIAHTANALKKAGHPAAAEDLLQLGTVPLEEMGSAQSLITYGPNWAQAVMAPRRLYKSESTEGGILSPAIIHYPGFSRQHGIDNSFFTVMDVMPTLLQLAGAQHPDSFDGHPVEPMLGKSMLSYLEGGTAPVHSDKEAVGWELFGQRALRQGNWKIAYVSPPNGTGHWELYDLATDPGERRDLGAKNPERMRAMQALWDQYAKKMGIVLHEQMVSPYTSE